MRDKNRNIENIIYTYWNTGAKKFLRVIENLTLDVRIIDVPLCCYYNLLETLKHIFKVFDSTKLFVDIYRKIN